MIWNRFSNLWKITLFWLMTLNYANSKVIDVEKCEVGTACSQCNERDSHILYDKTLVCCKNCESMTIEVWSPYLCVCYANDTNNRESLLQEYSISRKLLNKRSPQDPSSRILIGEHNNGFDNHINRQGILSTQISASRLDSAMQVLTEAIETLSMRVASLEELHQINRIGGPHSNQLMEDHRRCSSKFKLVGTKCVYFSVDEGHRFNWLQANDTCFAMSGILVEPVDYSSYLDLVTYISGDKKLHGNTYWIGGYYPGLSWRWYYDGHELKEKIDHFTNSNANPILQYKPPQPPTKVDHGYCLLLQHDYYKSVYSFEAGHCGENRYFICEELSKSHRMR